MTFAPIQDVAAFAKQRHGTQEYVPGHLHYDFHLVRVTQKLSMHGFTDYNYQAGGWTHDLIEDTETTLQELVERCGHFVGALVWCVTGIGHNRKTRNQNIADKCALFPPACILKTADRLVNHETSICDPGKNGEPSIKHLLMYLNEREKFEAMVKGHIPESMWDELQRQYARMEELARA